MRDLKKRRVASSYASDLNPQAQLPIYRLAMSHQTRHFILTADGIREFSPDQAAMIAAGMGTAPEFAQSRVRYLQLTVQDTNEQEFEVAAAGGCIEFDQQGRLRGAGAPKGPDEQISSFEYDTCVQWALREACAGLGPTFH